jgi:hypothetical protein
MNVPMYTLDFTITAKESDKSRRFFVPDDIRIIPRAERRVGKNLLDVMAELAGTVAAFVRALTAG